MQCRECGAAAEADASFCEECGKPIHGGALAAKAASPAPSILGLAEPPQPAAARVRGSPIAAPDDRPFARIRSFRKWNSPETALSHWNELLRGVDVSTMEFCRLVRAAIRARRVPEIKLGLIAMREGGIFSDK